MVRFIQFAMDRLSALVSRLRSNAFNLLSSLAHRGPATDIAKFTLNLFKWRLVQLNCLSSCAGEVIELGPSGTSTIAAPKFFGIQSVVQHGRFPPVRAKVVKGNLFASSYSSGVLMDEQLLVPRDIFLNWRRIRLGHGSLFRTVDGILVGRAGSENASLEGILIGGEGAFNWYHFIIEILPKIYLIKGLPDALRQLPLLVPDVCRSIPAFSEALALYSGERVVHFFSKQDIICAKRLVVVDEISTCPFNLAPGLWPVLGDFKQHDELLTNFLADFRGKVLSGRSINSVSRAIQRRIFLVRSKDRRNYNQDELISVSKRYGFETFSAEDFSVRDQARAFSESSMVIGPSGAAWVGIIFQENPLRCLTWLPREYSNFCCYSSLANLLGHRLNFITVNTSLTLTSTGDGYLADYYVCPTVFERALVSILEDTA